MLCVKWKALKNLTAKALIITGVIFGVMGTSAGREGVNQHFKEMCTFAETSVLASDGAEAGTEDEEKIKVACIGDSITFGYGITDKAADSYPSVLNKLLGKDYEVKNFGVLGATMLKKGNLPYWDQPYFNASMEWLPDIVVIMLGTNDTKPYNWEHASEFPIDYADMIQKYKGLSSNPAVIVNLPPTVYSEDTKSINDQVLRDGVIPDIARIAGEKGCYVADTHTATADMPDDYADKVHPKEGGALAIANTVFDIFKAAKLDRLKTDSPITVRFNGKEVHFDVEPAMINGRVMVPFRAIFEAMGASVEWDDMNKTVSGVKEGIKISLLLNDKRAKVNDEEIILDAAPTVVKDRTLVPLRFISENFGLQVLWNEEAKTVDIK